MEIFGVLGTLFFAISILPQICMAIKNGNINGLSVGMLWLWISGSTMFFMYSLHLRDTILIINYAWNLATEMVLVYYWLWPRKDAQN